MTQKEKTVIGRNASVDFIGYVSGVPAKIDTGADSSTVWASSIRMDPDGTLHFCLFDTGSEYFTGDDITTTRYKSALVRSTSGHVQVRYRVEMSIRIEGRRVRASVTLSDRSQQQFPVLIGRRTLSGKFLVDVSKAHYPDAKKVFTMETNDLNDQLMTDPYKFHSKYFEERS